MKLPTLLIAASLIALAASTESVRANTINGDVDIKGKAIPDVPANLLASTKFVAFGLVKVNAGTGDYASTVGSSVAYSPFTFVPPTTPIIPLWSFVSGGLTYKFDATSMNVLVHTATQVKLEGVGIAKITGFDDTPGTWSFEADKLGQVHYLFDSPESVPDGGLTVALLGFALAGVEGLRRKLLK